MATDQENKEEICRIERDKRALERVDEELKDLSLNATQRYEIASPVLHLLE